MWISRTEDWWRRWGGLKRFEALETRCPGHPFQIGFGGGQLVRLALVAELQPVLYRAQVDVSGGEVQGIGLIYVLAPAELAEGGERVGGAY